MARLTRGRPRLLPLLYGSLKAGTDSFTDHGSLVDLLSTIENLKACNVDLYLNLKMKEPLFSGFLASAVDRVFCMVVREPSSGTTISALPPKADSIRSAQLI